MGRGGRCENIWRVLLIGSSVHPPIRVRNMGAHCAHVEDPRGSTHRIYYRDSVDASKERRRGLVGIPTLGGRTKICGAEKHCDIHWETAEHSDRLGGHEANIGFMSKGRRANRRWITEAEMVGPDGPTRARGKWTAGWEDRNKGTGTGIGKTVRGEDEVKM